MNQNITSVPRSQYDQNPDDRGYSMTGNNMREDVQLFPDDENSMRNELRDEFESLRAIAASAIKTINYPDIDQEKLTLFMKSFENIVMVEIDNYMTKTGATLTKEEIRVMILDSLTRRVLLNLKENPNRLTGNLELEKLPSHTEQPPPSLPFYPPSGPTAPSPPPFGGPISSYGGAGKVATLNISSMTRDLGVGNFIPNVLSTSLYSVGGDLDYYETITNATAIQLTEISLNFSHLAAAHPNGLQFYVGIDEVTTDMTRQSITRIGGQSKQCLFKCYIGPVASPKDWEVMVLTTKPAIFPSPKSIPGTITIRLFTQNKLELPLEQDIYMVTSHVMNIVEQSYDLTLPINTISSGEEILIRGLTITADPDALSDTKRFRAHMVTPTLLRLDLYITGPIVESEARVICLNKVVQMSFDILYE